MPGELTHGQMLKAQAVIARGSGQIVEELSPLVNALAVVNHRVRETGAMTLNSTEEATAAALACRLAECACGMDQLTALIKQAGIEN